MDLKNLKNHWINDSKISFHTDDQLYINDKLYLLKDDTLHDKFADWVVFQSYDVLKDACNLAVKRIENNNADKDTVEYLKNAIRKSNNI